MITPELETYIRQQLGARVAKESIIQHLSEKGWVAQDITDAFSAIESAQPQSQPLVTPPPVVQAPVQTPVESLVQPAVAASHKGVWALVIILLLLLGAGGAYAAYQYDLLAVLVPPPVVQPVATSTSVADTTSTTAGEVTNDGAVSTLSPTETFLAMRRDFIALATAKGSPQALAQDAAYMPFLEKYMTGAKVKEFESLPEPGKELYVMSLSLAFPNPKIDEKNIGIKEVITDDTAVLNYSKDGGTVSGGGMPSAQLTAGCTIKMTLENGEWKSIDYSCESK